MQVDNDATAGPPDHDSTETNGSQSGPGRPLEDNNAAVNDVDPLTTATEGPPLAMRDGDRLYSGRPVRGATSAALYLSGEWETGAPPPPVRDAYRYLVGEGADGLPRVDLGGHHGGSSGSRVLEPALVANAREALKRPAFPDRRMPLPRTGAGSAGVRGLALAADFDEAAALEARASEAASNALAQLANLR